MFPLWKHILSTVVYGASLVAQMIKNLPAVQETWIPFLGQEDLLEKGMATHFSIPAWRIPRTEEPGGLQSMGYKESDMTEQLTHIPICICIVNPTFLCGHIVCPQLYICIVYQPLPSTWVLPGTKAICTSRDTHYNIFELNTELKPPTNRRC